jgi:hypothetical protein
VGAFTQEVWAKKSEVVMVSRWFHLCALVALMSVSAFADGLSVSYELTEVSSNTYIYIYSVTNNSVVTSSPLILDIYFDPSLYDQSSLTILTPNPCTGDCAPSLSWSQDILYSVGNPPATYQDFAAFDAESPAGGIPVGDTVTGFEVEFTWLGVAGTLPSDQPFDVYESPNYSQPIQADSTTYNIAAAPEPSTLSYMLGILLACGAGIVSRKLRARNRNLSLSPGATRS